MNLNKVFILGRVTADVQVRTTPNGQSVAGFGVATNRVWNAKTGGRQEETEFHNIVAWGRQAEVAGQYLTKGAMVLVEGRMRTRSWQDKQNQTHKVTEIICERLQLGPRAAGSSGGGFTPKASGGSAPKGEAPDLPPVEEIPTIDLEEDLKSEDLPF